MPQTMSPDPLWLTKDNPQLGKDQPKWATDSDVAFASIPTKEGVFDYKGPPAQPGSKQDDALRQLAGLPPVAQTFAQAVDRAKAQQVQEGGALATVLEGEGQTRAASEAISQAPKEAPAPADKSPATPQRTHHEVPKQPAVATASKQAHSHGPEPVAKEAPEQTLAKSDHTQVAIQAFNAERSMDEARSVSLVLRTMKDSGLSAHDAINLLEAKEGEAFGKMATQAVDKIGAIDATNLDGLLAQADKDVLTAFRDFKAANDVMMAMPEPERESLREQVAQAALENERQAQGQSPEQSAVAEYISRQLDEAGVANVDLDKDTLEAIAVAARQSTNEGSIRLENEHGQGVDLAAKDLQDLMAAALQQEAPVVDAVVIPVGDKEWQEPGKTELSTLEAQEVESIEVAQVEAGAEMSMDM